MLRVLSMLSCVALLCVGCSSVDDSDSDTPTPIRSAANPPAAEKHVAATGDDAMGTYQVRFETTKGNFVIEVHRKWAPIGAEHFYELIQDGFYNNVAFFRAVPNFMVQFGISGDPAMNKKWEDSIQDDPVVMSNKRGYITYAKTSAPNSRSTQVFINYRNNARLDSMDFAPFGVVLDDGMQIVDSINQEYGEPPPDAQERITMQGNSYLKMAMPNLDYIKTATIIAVDGKPVGENAGDPAGTNHGSDEGAAQQ